MSKDHLVYRATYRAYKNPQNPSPEYVSKDHTYNVYSGQLPKKEPADVTKLIYDNLNAMMEMITREKISDLFKNSENSRKISKIEISESDNPASAEPAVTRPAYEINDWNFMESNEDGSCAGAYSVKPVGPDKYLVKYRNMMIGEYKRVPTGIYIGKSPDYAVKIAEPLRYKCGISAITSGLGISPTKGEDIFYRLFTLIKSVESVVYREELMFLYCFLYNQELPIYTFAKMFVYNFLFHNVKYDKNTNDKIQVGDPDFLLASYIFRVNIIVINKNADGSVDVYPHCFSKYSPDDTIFIELFDNHHSILVRSDFRV